jgi:hypothetical protein
MKLVQDTALCVIQRPCPFLVCLKRIYCIASNGRIIINRDLKEEDRVCRNVLPHHLPKRTAEADEGTNQVNRCAGRSQT